MTDETCLRALYAEDRDVCGCSKCVPVRRATETETEACMSGWDVPQSEIDRLARVITPEAFDGSVYLNKAGLDLAQLIARTKVERILSDLAENPPKCAVEAMARIEHPDGWTAIHLPKWARVYALAAAINAIRGEK